MYGVSCNRDKSVDILFISKFLIYAMALLLASQFVLKYMYMYLHPLIQ